MNILAIGAHPDDIEFGCGGTLSKFSSEGHNVYLLVLTDGAMGGDKEERKKEQMESVKIMNAKNLFFGGFEDSFLQPSKQLISHIEDIQKKVKPQLIFVNYFDDTHQDHRHLTKGVQSATRYVQNILFYEGPTTQNFTPTVFTDIEDYLEQKLSCLKAHKSQIAKTNIKGLSIIEIAKSSSTFRGIQARIRCAEGFMPLRYLMNI